MEKHTVCLLNDAFPPIIDGVANAVVNYGREIGAHYGRAVVVTPYVVGAQDDRLPFPILRYPGVDLRRQIGYAAGVPFSPKTTRRLRAENVELLHAHCPVSSCFLARSLRDALSAPLVLSYHTKYDMEIRRVLRGEVVQREALRVLMQNIRSCDEVWTVSRGAEESLRVLGYEGECIVMENGVDLPRGAAAREAVDAVTEKYDLPDGIPVFLFVGRMLWYKGLRMILDALRALHESGQDFRMVFVGEGADGAAVRRYAQKLGGKCLFLDMISDRNVLRAWYTRADLFLFPSAADTNGLVVREAAACGTAAVLTAGSCAAEGVTDGRNGFLMKGNAASLTTKLRELYSKPETVQRVGEYAQRELYLSWETAVGRAWERYEVVLDNYRSGRCKKHDTPLDGFLKAQGKWMDALAGAYHLPQQK